MSELAIIRSLAELAERSVLLCDKLADRMDELGEPQEGRELAEIHVMYQAIIGAGE